MVYLELDNQLVVIIVIVLMVALVCNISWLQPMPPMSELLSVLIFEISKSLLITVTFITVFAVVRAAFQAAQLAFQGSVRKTLLDGSQVRPSRRPSFKQLFKRGLAWIFQPIITFIQQKDKVITIPLTIPLVDSVPLQDVRPLYTHLKVWAVKDEFDMPGDHIGPIEVYAVPSHQTQPMVLRKEWYYRRNADQSVSVKPVLSFVPLRDQSRFQRPADEAVSASGQRLTGGWWSLDACVSDAACKRVDLLHAR